MCSLHYLEDEVIYSIFKLCPNGMHMFCKVESSESLSNKHYNDTRFSVGCHEIADEIRDCIINWTHTLSSYFYLFLNFTQIRYVMCKILSESV